jgi:hypothetical protein
MSQTYSLLRDCNVTAIPAGEKAVLPAGAEVFIVQTLGGNITVRTDHGLFRIAAADADAIAGFSLGAASGATTAAVEFSEQAVWAALKTCFDPEIPVNIVDLGSSTILRSSAARLATWWR